jgi:ribA/ribD-fused uncharacterized protein
MNMLPGDGENKTTDEAVYFYTPRYYVFDNFSACSVSLWGQVFPTAEHAYQWKKFCEHSPSVAQRILKAPSPYAVKKVSDAHKDQVSPDWSRQKKSVMEEILRAKLAQHEDVASKLKETHHKIIIENSPTDRYWGIGVEGTGQNILGTLWMKLRDEII